MLLYYFIYNSPILIIEEKTQIANMKNNIFYDIDKNNFLLILILNVFALLNWIIVYNKKTHYETFLFFFAVTSVNKKV